MKSSSHLLPGKLPRQFTSWTSTKTKIPNCIIFYCSTNHSRERVMEALPLLIYIFQIRADLILS